MNKKFIVLIIIILLVIISGIIYFINNNSNENESNDSKEETFSKQSQANSETSNNVVAEDDIEMDKILVVYFSAQGHTDTVAHKIAENLGADIFEIEPVDEYTSDDLDWTDSDSRVVKEHEDETLQNVELVSTNVENWDKYDTIIIGYPIWWGVAAWPVETFVKANDFNGKTVIPFCTSASSGLGRSGDLLAEEANGGNWQDGQRFRENPSDSDIKNLTDSIIEIGM